MNQGGQLLRAVHPTNFVLMHHKFLIFNARYDMIVVNSAFSLPRSLGSELPQLSAKKKQTCHKHSLDVAF